MKQPKIQCPKCEGSGTVDLGLEHFVTLQHVKVLRKVNPIELAKELGLPAMAVNNRLERLRKWGFLDRERDPQNLKANRYFLANSNGKHSTK